MISIDLCLFTMPKIVIMTTFEDLTAVSQQIDQMSKHIYLDITFQILNITQSSFIIQVQITISSIGFVKMTTPSIEQLYLEIKSMNKRLTQCQQTNKRLEYQLAQTLKQNKCLRDQIQSAILVLNKNPIRRVQTAKNSQLASNQDEIRQFLNKNSHQADTNHQQTVQKNAQNLSNQNNYDEAENEKRHQFAQSMGQKIAKNPNVSERGFVSSSQELSQSNSSEESSENDFFQRAKQAIINHTGTHELRYKINQTYDDFQNLKQEGRQNKLRLNQIDSKISKLEYQQQYLLKQYNEAFLQIQTSEDALKRKITQLKQSKDLSLQSSQSSKKIDESIAYYSQSMFWLLNSYFLSFRILKTEMVKKDKAPWQSKVGSILNNVKKVLSLFTKIQFFKTGLEVVCKIAQIYLDEESDQFNEKMFDFMTTCFLTQKEINNSISQSILLLIEKNFVLKRIQSKHIEDEREDKSITNLILVKARKWFQTKKNRLLEAISKMNIQKQLKDSTKIQILVVEDLAKIFAYIAVNPLQKISEGSRKSSSNSKIKILQSSNILVYVFHETLLQDKMDSVLVKAYNRSSESTQNQQQKVCCKQKSCLIY